jgi:hypothetical protein
VWHRSCTSLSAASAVAVATASEDEKEDDEDDDPAGGAHGYSELVGDAGDDRVTTRGPRLQDEHEDKDDQDDCSDADVHNCLLP